MKDGAEEFIVESTPVLDLKKHGLGVSASVAPVNEESWDSDRTEVYADVDGENAIAHLIGEQGENFPITTFPYVMGRGSECDLVLQGKGVSRRHAEIIFQSGRFVVNDLESLNGLKVNGYKVARVILEENDTIKLGDVGLTFRSGNQPGENSTATLDNSSAKAGLFSKKGKVKQEVVQDKTFGPGIFKRVLTGSLIVASLALTVLAGYKYLLGNQIAGRIDESAGMVESAQSVSSSAAEVTATQVNASSDQTPADINLAVPASALTSTPAAINSEIDPPPPISAPPPSIAKSAPPVATETLHVTAEPVAPKVEKSVRPSVVAAAPASKPSVSKQNAPALVAPPKSSPEAARNVAGLLESAEEAYFQGRAEDAMNSLKPLLDDSRIADATRKQVRSSYNNYSALFAQYSSGQAEFSRGNKESAFQQWTSFMDKESSLFSGRKSTYTRSISARVVDEYVALGNESSRKGDHHSAYRNWQKALTLGDSVAAKIAIDNANNKAMQLYRQALRLEYVNTTKAKNLWHEVVDLLPPGTEYNTKASAKLAWYDKWGT